MSTALIVNAIRNMFARKPKPHRQVDGSLGQETRIAIAEYGAKRNMPEPPQLHFWHASSYSRGGFSVALYRHAANGPRMVTGLVAPMSELSPETIAAMARTIMRATGGKR